MARRAVGAATPLDDDPQRAAVYAEVDPARLRPHHARATDVTRTEVLERLESRRDARVAVVAAPAGYGKSTAVRQWSERDHRDLVWLTCERSDADPVSLLRALAVAFDRVSALPAEVFVALGRSLEVTDKAQKALRRSLAERAEPFLLVLDDCHHLTGFDVTRCLGHLIASVPEGSLVVMSGRAVPHVPLGKLRLQGALVELEPADLALSPTEAEQMLDAAGVRLEPAELAELCDYAEGWAAGLHLAVMGASSPSVARHAEIDLRAPLARIRPTDRSLAEYLAEEVLTNIEPDVLSFLERSSVLERLSGAACDHVLERTGSADLLEHLAHTRSYFLAPLDAERQSYACNHLFADVLRDELARGDAEQYRHLHRRASEWYEQAGDVGRAVHHAVAAGDRDRVGDLILSNAMRFAARGRNRTVGVWLDQVDERWQTEVPAIALAGALQALGAGDVSRLERYLEAARQLPDTGPLVDGSPSLPVATAMVSAMAGRYPVHETRDHTEIVLAAGRDGNPWWVLATGLQGHVRHPHGRARDGPGPGPGVPPRARAGSPVVRPAPERLGPGRSRGRRPRRRVGPRPRGGAGARVARARVAPLGRPQLVDRRTRRGRLR